MDLERIAFAGDDHVVIFGDREARRATALLRDHRSIGRNRGGLGFLSAKPAAKALCNANNIFKGQAASFGHDVLGLGWMLGR